ETDNLSWLFLYGGRLQALQRLAKITLQYPRRAIGLTLQGTPQQLTTLTQTHFAAHPEILAGHRQTIAVHRAPDQRRLGEKGLQVGKALFASCLDQALRTGQVEVVGQTAEQQGTGRIDVKANL